jgi:anti-anti-sigma factor
VVRLDFETVEDVLVGHVEGEIDSANADELRAALSEKLTRENAGMVIDLAQVTYLDSVGVELLFDLARRLRTHRQRLRIVAPPGAPMRRVLDLCDISQTAAVDPTVEASVRGMGELAA